MTYMLHEKSGSLLLNVEDPFYIRDLLPKSKTLPRDDWNVAVQHTLEATKILRNIGFDVPAPIRSQYNWPGRYKPFDHQKTMAEFLTLHRRCFNLSEMGVGKSAAALWAADWLMKTKRVKKALILSPLSTLDRVWKHDIFDVLLHRTCSIVHGTRSQREAALAADVDFYILNHDGVTLKWLNDAVHLNDDINLVILDEASMFRNAQTEKYRSLWRMLRPDMRLWLMTGTPCPNAPTDAWALARLVDKARVPEYFGGFQRETMNKINQYKWVARPDAYSKAFDAMQPAVRFKKRDCLTLPPITFQDRQTSLSQAQADAFKKMKELMQAEAKKQVITAVNAADKINKLRQILCGTIKHPKTGEYVTLPHKPRLATLLECIEEAGAKVIVIVPFKGIIRDLQREVSKHYSCAILNGDITPKQRDLTIRAFKEQPDPHTLLCHPKVMAHGLNLTEADTTVFYGPIYSNDEFQQVVERFNRAGQKRKMTVIRIAAHPLEWAIYKTVDDRKTGQDNILDLYRSVTQ